MRQNSVQKDESAFVRFNLDVGFFSRDNLRELGAVLSPRGLGITFRVTDDDRLGLVRVLKGSIAEQVGLQSDTFITKVNGKSGTSSELIKMMSDARGGSFELSDHFDRRFQIRGYRPITPFGAHTIGWGSVKDNEFFPCITKIKPGSNAEKMGLKSGDIVVGIKIAGIKEILPVNTPMERESMFNQYLRSLRPHTPLSLIVKRDDKSITLSMKSLKPSYNAKLYDAFL